MSLAEQHMTLLRLYVLQQQLWQYSASALPAVMPAVSAGAECFQKGKGSAAVWGVDLCLRCFGLGAFIWPCFLADSGQGDAYCPAAESCCWQHYMLCCCVPILLGAATLLARSVIWL